jgi:hypothetical protein
MCVSKNSSCTLILELKSIQCSQYRAYRSRQHGAQRRKRLAYVYPLDVHYLGQSRMTSRSGQVSLAMKGWFCMLAWEPPLNYKRHLSCIHQGNPACKHGLYSQRMKYGAILDAGLQEWVSFARIEIKGDFACQHARIGLICTVRN